MLVSPPRTTTPIRNTGIRAQCLVSAYQIRNPIPTTVEKKNVDKAGVVLGENGRKLSGGEKQRLSIARALMRKPRLLIFDEATSALDSLTEEIVTRTVKEISAEKQQITILIAHRLSTILHADTIFVLEKGKIIEQGTHDELVERKGLYYAMWRQQIGERKAEPVE